MRVWPALILAPLAALAAIAFGYALVPAACGGREWALHALVSLLLLLSLATTALAWSGRGEQRDPFLPLVATWTGAFFSFVIAVMWATRLFLSPCIG